MSARSVPPYKDVNSTTMARIAVLLSLMLWLSSCGRDALQGITWRDVEKHRQQFSEERKRDDAIAGTEKTEIAGRIMEVKRIGAGDEGRVIWWVGGVNGHVYSCEWWGGTKSFGKGDEVLLTVREGDGRMIGLGNLTHDRGARVTVGDVEDLDLDLR